MELDELSDEHFMRLALDEARKAMEMDEVPVGCVLVDNQNRVVARGHNLTNVTCDATQHAELVALNSLLDTSIVHSLFVTIEPCIMCAAALRQLGRPLARVVFGARNDRFGGCGTVLDILQRKPLHSLCGIIEMPPAQVKEGVLANEAVTLLKDFYKQENVNAPEEKRRKK